ncbi:hypothetical protein ACQQ93_12960 [Lachnospiraceae bacterium SGI.256]
MNKKCIWVLCVMAVLIITMEYFIKPNSEEDVPMAPDVVSSISMNRDQYLTVVANRDNIEDKEEFAKLLIEMCKENSFHTIKFSTDRGYATSVDMRVYLFQDKIEGHEPVMIVKYEPIEYGKGYDIVHNPDQFKLTIDGKTYE